MKARRLLPLLFFLLPGIGFAQKEEKGVRIWVLDSLAKTPLEACTVLVQTKAATTKLLTNEKGLLSFSLADTAVLTFQANGYREKILRLMAKSVGVDTVHISPTDKLMEGIVVKAKLPPVVVRGDTTEFNIDSSMFEPFDAVEDLVKRLPGLEITEGGLRFQGKPIDRIFVDGESLFDETGNFAIKKIPAGMVAKIQVMDTKTLEQLFAGTPSDGESKTLNIRLKAGNKYFGSVEAGGGTRNQANVSANASRFRGAERYNLFGGYTASNRGGFFKSAEGPSSEAQNAGISYGNKVGPVRINAGYNFNQNDNANDYYRERTQLITADTSFFTKASNRFASQNNTHRFTLSANVWIDSSSILDLSLSYTRVHNQSSSTSSSLTAENGALRNESINRSLSTGNNDNWGGTVSWRKWLNRKGRMLSVNARSNAADDASVVQSQSTNTYFKSNAAVSGDTLHRRTINRNGNRSYGLNLSYSEPLSKTWRVALNANIDVNRSNSRRQQYDLDSLSQSAVLDTAFSAGIVSAAETKTLGTSLVHTSPKLHLSAGLTTVWQQVRRSLQKDELVQDLLRYSPALTASYNFSKEKVLRMNFSAATLQPGPDQIQPVPDNSNPLYVRVGNPNLRTAFSQNYSLSYSQNSVTTSLSATLGYAPVSNQIVSAVTYDAFRRVTTQYVNVDGTFSARGNVYLSRRFGKEKKMTVLTAGSAYTLGEQAFFQTGGRYLLRSQSFDGSLSLAKSSHTVRAPGYGLSFTASQSRRYTPENLDVLNTTRLSLVPALDGSCQLGPLYANAGYRLQYSFLDYHSPNRRNDEFVLHTVDGALRPQLVKQIFLQLNVSYQFNTQVPDGAPKGQFNSNLSATAQLWKSRGRAVVTVYDLFATRTQVRRIANDNYIEDVQTPNLRNYVTLKLQYSFSKLEKKAIKS